MKTNSISITEIENKTFTENDSPEIPPSDIVAYNELRSCADLYRMYSKGILEIRPEFQREIVWKTPAQTRFIDSLVKQLPIPSMCFSMDYRTEKWQVIDGLQRMATIIKFLSGEKWNLSKLDDIDPNLSGQPNSKFIDQNSDLHSYYVRVENLTLPITVLRCDYRKRDHTHYLFTIFHRLNSGGLKLNNQEIRNCIYAGTFNNLLKELNKNTAWMRLNRMKKDIGYRFTKQELILRFFAFHDSYSEYTGRLAKFLNDYMYENKGLNEESLMAKRNLFERTVNLVHQMIFEGKTPQKLPVTVLETTLVGVSFNLDYLASQPPRIVQSLYSRLIEHEELSDEKLREGLSGKPRVVGRLSASIGIFSGR
jgi:hypothetical protein